MGSRACVLNLAGLYGGERQPRNWLTRVAKTKAEVKGKGALHLVHGRDVARAIVCAHTALNAGMTMKEAESKQDQQKGEEHERSSSESSSGVASRRHIITDLRVYDWWDLFQAWGASARAAANADELLYERWVLELMDEEGVRALPRGADGLGRRLDGRGFWGLVGCWPEEGRVV